MAKKLLVSILALALMVVFIPFKDVEAAPIKIKMVGTLPVGHHLTTALEVFKKYVEKASNGRVVVELYPAQQLYNDKDLVTALPKGSVDMAIAEMAMFSGSVPAAEFVYFPLIFQDEDHFFRVAHGKVGEIFDEELSKARLKLLGWIHYGTLNCLFKSPVTKLEDFKGKRVRSYGRLISTFQQSLGLAPTMMSSGEMYDALQKGTIDGTMTGTTTFVSRKLFEVAKYMPDVDLSPVIPFMTLANLKFFNNQPKDIQKILMDGAAEVEKFTRKAANEDMAKARQALAKNGVTFTKISAQEVERWRAISMPAMIKMFKEKYDPKKVDMMFVELEKERKAPAATKPTTKKKRK